MKNVKNDRAGRAGIIWVDHDGWPACRSPSYPGLRRRFVRGHRTNDVGTTATCVTATIHQIATALVALTNEPAPLTTNTPAPFAASEDAC